MSKTWKLAIAVAIQTAVLMVMIGMKQWTLATGTIVLLETRPIDPRSLFRGDYVRLGYKIGNLDLAALDGDDDFRKHDTVYVVLDEGDPYWRPVSVHREMPDYGPGQVAIKGTARYVSQRRSGEGEGRTAHVSVRYGIENYFVPEGEGLALERPKPGEKVSIHVAVDSFGKAGIRAVLVDGEPRYIESLF